MSNFRGIWIALVTPMRANEIDFAALEKLVKKLLEDGVAGGAVQGQVADLVADLGQYMLGYRGLSVRSHCVLPALLLIFQVKSGVRWRIAGSCHANLPCTIDNYAGASCIFAVSQSPSQGNH